MKKTLRAFLIAQFFILASGCELDITNHNEFLAGDIAADFLNQILIEKNPEKAYALAYESLQKELPKQEFINTFGELANALDTKYIRAESFELVNNSDVIAVYFTVKNSSSTGFLRVGTYGDGENYKIISIKTVDLLPEKFDTSMAGTYQETGKSIERGTNL